MKAVILNKIVSSKIILDLTLVYVFGSVIHSYSYAAIAAIWGINATANLLIILIASIFVKSKFEQC